jgi:hypothetical protein
MLLDLSAPIDVSQATTEMREPIITPQESVLPDTRLLAHRLPQQELSRKL